MTASGAKDIFLDALDRSVAERSGFLDDACGGDAAVRQDVERLLAAHDDAEAGDLLADPTAESWASDPGRHASEPIGLGTFVGPYEIVEPLGEGGYGTVYLAQQETPVKRRVAVKILKLGLDLGHVIARFELERQALALMEHPGIARIIDAGTTEQGRPYFVMEYVDGHPITRYCDEHRLSIRERLELFEGVCQAIRHAHQKGIVHRDLKPTNVLVASVDGEHLPKVIDFGIAKVVSEAPVMGRDITVGHGLIGTPQYMSPEQAAGSPDLDTRTDIYSLGVVLYELLTGATPYDLGALKSAGIGGIFRYISENDPPLPSQRLGSGKTTVEDAAEARVTDPIVLRRIMKRDLDWIVMKALDRDREHRYETAAAFAEDIRRYLDGEPVSASPPSLRYRAGKFISRHRLAVSAAVLVLAALVIGLGGAVWGAVRAGQSAREATALNVFMRDVLSSAASDREGASVTLLSVLEQAADLVDTRFAEHPDQEILARDMLGDVFNNQALHRNAAAVLEPAHEMAIDLYGPDDDRTLNVAIDLLSSYTHVGRIEDIERIGPDLVRRLARKRGEYDRATIVAERQVIVADIRRGRWDDVEAAIRPLYAKSIRVLGMSDPGSRSILYNLTQALEQLGGDDRIAEAIQLTKASLAAPPVGDSVDPIPEFSARLRLGTLHRLAGEITEAAGELETLLADSEEPLAAGHWIRTDAAFQMSMCRRQLGEHDDAARWAIRSIEGMRSRLGDTSPTTMAFMDQVMVCLLYGDADEKGAEYAGVLESQVARFGGAESGLALEYGSLRARFLTRLGRHDEAAEELARLGDYEARLPPVSRLVFSVASAEFALARADREAAARQLDQIERLTAIGAELKYIDELEMTELTSRLAALAGG